MMTHYFLCSPAVLPTDRWAEAFPDGIGCELRALRASVRPRDAVWLPTSLVGWETTLAELAAALPQCPLVVLSATPDRDEALLALELGGRGYCHAQAVPGMLQEVALVVCHGGLWVGPELLSRVIGAARRALPAVADDLHPPGLSSRESEVAREVAAGLSNKEIAARLGITERTVKAHLGAVFEKLGVRDRLHLVLRLTAHADLPGPMR